MKINQQKFKTIKPTLKILLQKTKAIPSKAADGVLNFTLDHQILTGTGLLAGGLAICQQGFYNAICANGTWFDATIGLCGIPVILAGAIVALDGFMESRKKECGQEFSL